MSAEDNPNMRHPAFLHAMQQQRITFVADPADPKWDGERHRKHTAYRVADKVELYLEKWTPCYRPEYPDDWATHPDAHRALDMLGYQCSHPSGPVTVGPWRLNVLFFPVTRDWVIKLYRGERRILDLLEYLERRA